MFLRLRKQQQKQRVISNFENASHFQISGVWMLSPIEMWNSGLWITDYESSNIDTMKKVSSLKNVT